MINTTTTNCTEDSLHYPYYYFSYYPTMIFDDKTKKAMDIIKLLMDNKKLKVESVDNFIELTNDIVKFL